jgi:hypothetical protein
MVHDEIFQKAKIDHMKEISVMSRQLQELIKALYTWHA